MKISINDEWINIPSSLSEITLRQKIDFQNTYGKELDEMARSIAEMPDGFDKELELMQFQFEMMFKTMAFFTNCTDQALKESEFIDKIAALYYAGPSALNQADTILSLQHEFNWNNELWILDKPELKHGDRMTFGEMIDAKQTIQNMVGLGKGQWECLIPLSAIFLRKKDEAYQESFLYEDSERLKLMESLPLDITMNVAFFLNSSLNIYIKASQSLSLQELKEAESM